MSPNPNPLAMRSVCGRAGGRTSPNPNPLAGGRADGRAGWRAETNILPNPNPIKVKARYEEAYVPKP